MMQTIIARFTEISRAQEAIDALLERKYDVADISYVANDLSGDAAVSESRSPKATAGLGLLLGLGSFAIPAVGPLIAAGPLAAGLAGTTADAAAAEGDPLTRALVELGVPGRAAPPLGESVRRGGALVIMGARDAVADNITAILRSSGAAAVDWYPRDPAGSGA